MTGQGPNATHQTTSSLALWFWRRRFLKGFYRIWSCDADNKNKLPFPWPMKAPHEIWIWLAKRFWRKRSLKMVDGRTDDGRTDGPWLYYKLTNEPKGSGELKNPEAHGPQWLTRVNSYKSLIHHFSLSVAMATNPNEELAQFFYACFIQQIFLKKFCH